MVFALLDGAFPVRPNRLSTRTRLAAQATLRGPEHPYMLAKIHVTLKQGVLDPQGKAVHHALNDLGYNEVRDVHLGRYMEIELEGVEAAEAEARVRDMCEKLLANTVIESYRFTLEPQN